MPISVVLSQRRATVGSRHAPRVLSGKGAEREIADAAEASLRVMCLLVRHGEVRHGGRRCCVCMWARAGWLCQNSPCHGTASLKRCMRHVIKTIGSQRAFYVMCCCIVMCSSPSHLSVTAEAIDKAHLHRVHEPSFGRAFGRAVGARTCAAFARWKQGAVTSRADAGMQAPAAACGLCPCARTVVRARAPRTILREGMFVWRPFLAPRSTVWKRDVRKWLLCCCLRSRSP